MKNPVETENPISFDEACRGNPNKYLLQIKLISTCSVKAHIDPGEREGGGAIKSCPNKTIPFVVQLKVWQNKFKWRIADGPPCLQTENGLREVQSFVTFHDWLIRSLPICYVIYILHRIFYVHNFFISILSGNNFIRTNLTSLVNLYHTFENVTIAP